MEPNNSIQLTDPDIYPDEKVLKQALGNAYHAYTTLMRLYDANDMTHEWRFYRDGKAWLCKVQKKKRTIVWMSVWSGYLKATVYFPLKYLQDVYALDISKETRQHIEVTKNVGKSKPCTFEVRNEKVLEDFKNVMLLKILSK